MRLPHPAQELLTTQFGIASRQQLLEWMTRHSIESHVRHRRLVPIERGVYRSHTCPPLPHQAALAGALRCGPGARITGPFALAVRGVDGVGLRDPWEILLPPGRRITGVSFVHRPDPSPHDPTDWIGRLPLAPTVTALVDSGRYVQHIGRRALRLSYDSCRWRKLITTSDVRDRIRSLGPGDAGARVFAEWDSRGELEPESDGERDLGRLLCRFSPTPTPQARVAGYRIDWYWPRYAFGFEYFGVTDHTSAIDRVGDMERMHALLRHGIEIHPVVGRDLREGSAFLRRAHGLLSDRARELGVTPPGLL